MDVPRGWVREATVVLSCYEPVEKLMTAAPAIQA